MVSRAFKFLGSLLLILVVISFVKDSFTIKAANIAYYVAPTGNDTNSGSQTAPWKTIQKAANTASIGDVVNVVAGTYNERVTVTRAGIVFTTSAKASLYGFIINANDTTVKGFEITNGNTVGNGFYIRNAVGGNIENNYIHDVGSMISDDAIKLFAPPTDQSVTRNITVKNNTIYHGHQSCIFVAGQNNIIEGNDCSHTIQPFDVNGDADCFRYFGSGHIFRGNYCHDIPFDGVSVRDSHTDCFQTFGDPAIGHDILFEKNFCNIPYSTSGLAAKGWQTEAGAYNLTIKNNIIVANLLGIFKAANNITIINNTFVGQLDTAQGIQFINVAPVNVVAKNNVFYHIPSSLGALDNETGGGTIAGGNNCTYQVGGNIHYPEDVNGLNPLFVNLAGNDYHLMSNSPCLDKGTNVGVITDKDGVSRPQGVGYDMGAYEYSTNTTATPNTAIASPTPVVKPGDANGDNLVNETDYSSWLSHYGQSISGIFNADFNGDGKVDGVDYIIWLNNYGK